MEETLLRRVAEGRSEPTLRLRRAFPSVWIGVFQDPHEDVDLEACRELGLPVVRRYNPGGAVVQDEGTFCFSAFFPRQPAFSTLGIQKTGDLYAVFGRVVRELGRLLGVDAAASPVNDVTIGGRKFYGSAQLEMGPAVVHSGSFLVHADLDRMARVLRPSRLKYADRGFTGVRERVVNLSEAAGRSLIVEDVMKSLVSAISANLPVTLTPGALTSPELEDAASLLQKKYATEEWTFPKRRPGTTTLGTRAAGGVLIIELALDGELIRQFDVRGDFLMGRPEILFTFRRESLGLSIREAQERLRLSPLPLDLREGLDRLLEESLRVAPNQGGTSP